MPVPLQTVDNGRQSLRQTAYTQIKRAIFDGTLEPGEMLSDHELRAWIGASRTPIREALNDLARAGLIEMAAQRYTRVTAAAPESRTAAIEAFGVLFGSMLRLTLPSLSSSQRAQIVELLHGRSRLPANATVLCDERLVSLMLDLCPNTELTSAASDSLEGLAYRIRIASVDECVQDDVSRELQDAFCAAVLANDGGAAEAVVTSMCAGGV